MEAYKAPWWLPERQSQTLFNSLLPPAPIAFRRERWRTPQNDDFIDVDWAGPEHAPRLLVFFHGLEGNSGSHYVRRIGAAALETGCWRIAVPHFRSCSGWLNERARLYFSGDSDEIDWILERFRGRTDAAISALGVSLGGNSLLKWLCVRGASARQRLGRAVALSAQFALQHATRPLGAFFSHLYGWYFLDQAGMRQKAFAKLDAFPDELRGLGVRRERVATAATLPEFDDALVAPLHGFGDAQNYWRLCSTDSELGKIAVPTLLLNAWNDPFYPGELLPAAPSSWIQTDFPESGGHAGFPGRKRWLARRVLEFLSPA